MKCPRCRNIDLIAKKHRETGVRLDVCRKCRGIWFDGGELERVLDVALKDLRPPHRPAEKGLLCPRCNALMPAFQYPQTLAVIEMCRKCRGVWLDGREFAEIKTVRENLRRRRLLEEHAPIGGVKGAALWMVDSAIEQLKFWR